MRFALPRAICSDSTLYPSSPAGVRASEAQGEGRRQKGDGKCVPWGHRWSRKCTNLHLADTCAGMFGRRRCRFVALPSVCRRRCHLSVLHSRLAARTGHSAARATALTLVSWRCLTNSKDAAGHRPERSGGRRARPRLSPGTVFVLVNVRHTQLLL